MDSFASLSAIITGAAGGIGLATARLLHSRGASVALVDVNAAAGAAALASLGAERNRAIFIEANLAQPEQAEVVTARAAQAFGNVNALVNNAAIQRYGTVEETSLELWHEVLSINLTAAFAMSRACLPRFRQAGGGAIVNVGSIQSHVSQRGAAAYVTSKHALLGLTRSLAVDYIGEGIRTNCVCPGTTDTPMWRWSVSLDSNPASVIRACEQMHPIGRIAQPEEVAAVIAFLLSDTASFVNGVALDVDSGLRAFVGGAPAAQE